ncbi:hypothetical protein Tco_0344778 [Tanacetum coccineum]
MKNKKLQILCKLSKKARKPAGDSQALEAQVKELVFHQGFQMSPLVILATSSEGTSTKPGVLIKEKVTSEENIDSDEDEEKKDDTDDDKSINLEMTDDEETDDEFVHGDEQVNDDEDEEMTNAEVEESRKGNAKISDVAKADAGKTDEIKDDAKKAKLPPISSSLSLRVAKLEKDVSELKKIDHSAEALATLKFPTVVEHYLGSKIGDDLQKSASEIRKIKREQAEKQKMPKYTIKSTDKATLKEYDLKSALYQTMHEIKSFNRNDANHTLYHALMEALIEDENVIDKGVADKSKKKKRQRTKESESSKKPSTTKETPKGKAPLKGSKTGKYASTKESVKEPIAKVVMDEAVNTVGEDVVRDDD